MAFNLFGKKAVEEPKKTNDSSELYYSDVEGLHKAYIPNFLYKPPFGYPRKDNLLLARELAKNPYIYSIIKGLCDEVASTEFDIVYKKDMEPNDKIDKIKKEILAFTDDPNGNKESFQQILRAMVKDIYEVDSGILVKAFNKYGKFVELYARDGISFLKNPDIYGYMGNRSDYIAPINYNEFSAKPDSPDWQATINSYSLQYGDQAAYFQYGVTAMALPVPFGKKEIMFIMQNPRSDSVYGLSPVLILQEIILSLVYGSNYNLDFYQSDIPDGILTAIGAKNDQIKALREKLQAITRVKDEKTGFWRKVGFKVPIANVETKFTPFKLDPKMLQIIEQQEWFTKLVWACFGVNADSMGYTDKSNKAVSDSQTKLYKRKAIKPLLETLKYHFDKELISEWGPEACEYLEWKWNDYDLEEDIKKHQLLESEIRMGIKTPEMVAEELQIDLDKLREGKEAQRAQEKENLMLQNSIMQQRMQQDEKKEVEKKSFSSFDNDLEREFTRNIEDRTKKLLKAFDDIEKNQVDNIR